MRQGRTLGKSGGRTIFASIATSVDITEPHVGRSIQRRNQRTRKNMKMNLSIKKINKKSNFRIRDHQNGLVRDG